MRKNFTQLITHFLSTRRYLFPALSMIAIMAVVVYAYAAVGVTVSGGSTFPISADLAANATVTTPGYTSVGTIIITEQDAADVSASGNILLNAPTGWRFGTGASASVVLAQGETGGNNSASIRVGTPVTSSNGGQIIIPLTYSNNNKREEIRITGVTVQALNGGNIPGTGNITISLANGAVVAGLPATVGKILSQAPGVARKLAFETPPSTVETGAAITPAPQVAIQDQFGNTVTTATNSVTLTRAINSSLTGVLTPGTATRTNGVITFTGASINAAGVGYQLVAASNGLASATSAAFTVNNPRPVITAVSGCLSVGDTETTVTITGENFVSGATVTFGGVSVSAMVNSASTITAVLSQQALANAGDKNIVVTNPLPASSNGVSTTFVKRVEPLYTALINGDSETCASSRLRFFAGSGVSYNWSIISGDAIIASDPTERAVLVDFGNSTGTVELSVVINNQCGKPGPATTKTITVNPLPTANIPAPASTEACVGSAVTLTADPVEGATYQWYRGSTAVTAAAPENTYDATVSGNYRVVVKYSGTTECSATSNTVAVTIKPLPTATITQGASATYCAEGITTLTAQESGTGYEYQWYLNDSPIENAIERSLVVNAAGAYTVEVFRNGCSKVSSPTTVTELPLPTAEITPESATEFCAGGSVVLNATLGAGYKYKWFAEGSTTVLDSDASFTTSTLGSYYVEITGPNGCPTTSASVAVVVNQPPVATIEVTGPAEFCAGESVFLNAPDAPFGSIYEYEWYLNGGTTAIGTGQTFEAAESGTYTVKVINTTTGCETTSAGVVVKEGTLEFAIFTYTGATEFCEGGSLQLNAIAPPAGQTYTYRWFNEANTTVATTRSFIARTTGTYQVEITETSIAEGCVRTSDPIDMTVNPQPKAEIDGGSQSLCAEADNTTSFSVSGKFSGGTAVWSSNNTNFVIQNAVYNTATGIATATVVATGSGDATISLTTSSTVVGCIEAADAIVLNVKPLPAAIITPQGPTAFCQGGSVQLDAPAGDGYNYQWYLNGAPVIGNGSSYIASLPGNYYVVVTNNGCPVQSPSVAVTVYDLPTATIEASGPIVFCEGGSVTLNAVTDIGTSFTWYNGSTQVGTGQTFVATTSGSYTVKIESNDGCPNTSAATQVTVNPTPDATIQVIGSTTFCENQSVLLRAPAAPAGQTYAYQWFNGTTLIAVGGTSRDYQATTSGNYTVRVTNTGTALNCSATTVTPVAVTVNPLPTASILYTGSTTLCQGSSLLLTGQSDTGTSYIWYRNGTQVGTGLTYSANQTGSYTVRATNSNTCTSNMSAVVQVTVNQAITGNAISGTQTVCSGSAIAALGQAAYTTLAGGATPYAYQWQVSTNNSTWDNITTGGNAPSYTPPVQTVTTATTTYYRRIVSGGNCSSESASVSVTVTPLPAKPSITNLAASHFTGDAAVAMSVSPAGATGGSFTVKNAAGQTVSTSATFTPCALGAGTYTVTYAYTSGGCSNTSEPITVTINQSTYKAVVISSMKPFCQGDNVTHTVEVWRDATVIYPYLTNEHGDPVRADGTAIGPQELPVTNPNYEFPANTPEVIKQYAFRYFNPIVKNGVEVKDGITYQWTKNQQNESFANTKSIGNAGLSSLDYYAVYVTVGGGSCGPNFTRRISSRTYTAEQANYNITLSADPNSICQGAPVTFTASLDENFPWSTSNLVLNWMVNGVVMGTTNHTTQGTAALTFTTTGPAGGFKHGDRVTVDFNTDIEEFDKTSKCRDRSNSNVIEMDVNDIALAPNPTQQNPVICLNGSATFNAPVTTTGSATETYIWTVGTRTYTSEEPGFSVPAEVTSVAGSYPVSVVVSNSCETTSTLELGTLTVKPALTSFTVSGGGSYCAGTIGTLPILLSGSEEGVNYSLWRDGVWEQTLSGTGGALEFTAPNEAGTYLIRAAYATDPLCSVEMTGSATITETPVTEVVDASLQVVWNDESKTWTVTALESDPEGAFSYDFGSEPIRYTWYRRESLSTDISGEWGRFVQDGPSNIYIENAPGDNVQIKVEIFNPETCTLYRLHNIGVQVLPVEIIYMNASKQGNDVVLEWATAMEQDNAGFEVQVSTDGFNYRVLTFVPSKNANTSIKQVYAFMDKENGKHGTRYYRLKQVDTNGIFEFFGPKAVSFGGVASKVLAYPNPFHDEVTLDIAAEQAGELVLVLTDAAGRQLLERRVAVEQGFTTEKLRLEAGLPRGLYILKAHLGGQTQYLKLVKE